MLQIMRTLHTLTPCRNVRRNLNTTCVCRKSNLIIFNYLQELYALIPLDCVMHRILFLSRTKSFRVVMGEAKEICWMSIVKIILSIDSIHKKKHMEFHSMNRLKTHNLLFASTNTDLNDNKVSWVCPSKRTKEKK